MTQIDFYIIDSLRSTERWKIACRITEKAYQLKHRVHLHTSSDRGAQYLDDLLWTFRDRSFVPHAIEPENAEDWQVTIGHGWLPIQCEVLINLAKEVPVFFSQFDRIAEIVNNEPPVKAAGRARYRFYREQGYPLEHHQINA